MDPAVYWRAALGLFWAFMFFMLLVLVIGSIYMGYAVFYLLAVILSAILLVFLGAFILFEKRIKAGYYLCIVLSALFTINQAFTLSLVFSDPFNLLSSSIMQRIVGGPQSVFPAAISVLLLLWAVFLLIATLKSKPVFETEKKKDGISWLSQIKGRGN